MRFPPSRAITLCWQQLLDARIDRLAYLEDKRTNLIEDANDTREELESLLGGEEDNAGEGGAEEEEGGGGGGEEEDEEEDEVSIFEQRLQLLEELARVTAELDAVRLQEWVRSIGRPVPHSSHFREPFSPHV